jgi:hypothetical protein
MKYTMINEYYPPSNEAVVLLGQSIIHRLMKL